MHSFPSSRSEFSCTQQWTNARADHSFVIIHDTTNCWGKILICKLVHFSMELLNLLRQQVDFLHVFFHVSTQHENKCNTYFQCISEIVQHRYWYAIYLQSDDLRSSKELKLIALRT